VPLQLCSFPFATLVRSQEDRQQEDRQRPRRRRASKGETSYSSQQQQRLQQQKPKQQQQQQQERRRYQHQRLEKQQQQQRQQFDDLLDEEEEEYDFYPLSRSYGTQKQQQRRSRRTRRTDIRRLQDDVPTIDLPLPPAGLFPPSPTPPETASPAPVIVIPPFGGGGPTPEVDQPTVRTTVYTSTHAYTKAFVVLESFGSPPHFHTGRNFRFLPTDPTTAGFADGNAVPDVRDTESADVLADGNAVPYIRHTESADVFPNGYRLADVFDSTPTDGT